MRRICVGDLQGCLEPLERLLGAVGFSRGDRLYSVGDLVNRGPDSLGVLRRLHELDARCVLGNHDLSLLRLAAGTAKKRYPLLEPVLRAPDATRLLEWLAAQPVLRVEKDLAIVHGGLHPHWSDLRAAARTMNAGFDAARPDRDERVRFATEVRHCTADGARPEVDDPPPGPPFKPWDHWYRGERTVVFGHWAMRGLVRGKRVRGLDSGCVYGGPLTAWIAEEDRLVQVPGLRGGSRA
ncbi:MAG: metallophosphoesterase [Deltaproteobacteria bacterium]|nr:metallophosphoesterase [Deltaproteobacteria bacterium]